MGLVLLTGGNGVGAAVTVSTCFASGEAPVVNKLTIE